MAHVERNLSNARELFETYLDTVFATKGAGWVERPVGELAEHSLGKMLDRSKNRGVPQPYLRNLNVRWFEFDLTDVLQMKFEEHEAERYSVRRGDVVICEGGYPGRAAIWDRDETVFIQKALHRVRFHNPEHSRWFLYFLYRSDIAKDLQRYFTGSGIQHFTRHSLSRFVIPVAPQEVIHQTVQNLDRLFDEVQILNNLYSQKLASLAELKQSLLQKAFSGELTPKEAERQMAVA